MKIRFIQDASRAWRFFSVQAMAISGAALGAWAMLPDDLKSQLPAEWVAIFSGVVLALGIFGRLVDQGGAK